DEDTAQQPSVSRSLGDREMELGIAAAECFGIRVGGHHGDRGHQSLDQRLVRAHRCETSGLRLDDRAERKDVRDVRVRAIEHLLPLAVGQFGSRERTTAPGPAACGAIYPAALTERIEALANGDPRDAEKFGKLAL